MPKKPIILNQGMIHGKLRRKLKCPKCSHTWLTKKAFPGMCSKCGCIFIWHNE